MKICAISPLVSTSEKEILSFISKCQHDLIVLPGNTSNHPSHRRVANALQDGVFAFVEEGPGKGRSVPWLVSNNSQVRMPSQILL